MKQYETFGETLAQMMRQHGCTVKELTAQMGFKSANTIARLLSDKSSTNKIKSFCAELLRDNPLHLSESEKQRLRETVVAASMGLDRYAANRHMLGFVQERPQSPACVCDRAFGDGAMFIGTLDDLFASYDDLPSVTVLVQNCTFGGVMRAVKGLLEQTAIAELTVEHHVSASERRAEEIAAFLHLLDAMGHPNYQLFLSPRRGGGGFSAAYGNLIVVLTRDDHGNCFTDLITFQSEDSFTVRYHMPGEASQAFHLYQFGQLRQQHEPVKETLRSESSLTGMLDYARRLLEKDQRHPLLSIRPDISMAMVPEDIARATLSSMPEGTNLDAYLQVVARRHQLFQNPVHSQCYLFSQAGMYQFVTQGKSRANFFGLRDMTSQERRQVVAVLLEALRRDNGTTALLLKNELRYNRAAFLLYGKDTLLIDNYPGFRNFDASRCGHSCWLQTPHVVESFSQFAEDVLLTNYVCTREQTLEFLESLIASPSHP